MATGNNDGHVNKVLLLWPKFLGKNVSFLSTILFLHLNDFIDYLYKNIIGTDTFDLHLPGEYLEKILENSVVSLGQVGRICAYYTNIDDLKRDQDRFQFKYDKLQFCLERDLEKQLGNAETQAAVSSSRSIDRGAIDNITTSVIGRLHAKRSSTSDRHSPVPKRFAPTPQHGFHEKNIEQIDPHFICPSCRLVFKDPYQLDCGHRQCKLCIDTTKNCATCSEVISNDKAWLDRGLQNEIQKSSINCSNCGWTGPLRVYQEHIRQNHHQFIMCPICNERIDRSESRLHYLNEIHQRNLTVLCLALITKPHVNTDPIEDTISVLSNSTNVLNGDIQRMSRERISCSNTLQTVAQRVSSLNTLAQGINARISGTEFIQNVSYQEILSLKQYVEDSPITSVDGTYTWKITNFQKKTMDAISERNKSIYSPIFYSSPTGYKMRLRLYLNGDSNTRGTHMSLFLVIMRGEHDAIVHWPFKFKVKFSLLNQSSLNNNHSASFWSDTTSTCFQRPTTGMNIGYGFPKFAPLDMLNQNEYIQNDTVFIKVEVDFLAERLEFPLMAGVDALPNDDEHVDTIDENFAFKICQSNTLQ